MDRLQEILLTYNFFEKELGMWRGTRVAYFCWMLDLLTDVCPYFNPELFFVGYAQGMSDLCSPIYVVCGADEAATFWCFVSVMERMVSNLRLA